MDRYFIADWINNSQFGYTCPFCFVKVNKDGRPRKNSKNLVHRHGSCGNLENRIEDRSPHCPYLKGNIQIEINSNTLRK